MISTLLRSALLVLLPSLSAPAAGPLTAKEIMQKNEQARKIEQMVTKTRITTGNKVKEFTLWRKKHEDGVHNKTFTRFHSPAEVRNEGILIVENESGRNDVLIYLPTFKKIRRVETQQQSGSFMGSVFSYSDIATPHVEDYDYQLIKEESCPSVEAKTIRCYVIDAKPVNEDIRDRTGYIQSKIWVRSDNFMMVSAEYTGLQGKLIKKLKASQLKMVDAVKKTWHSHYVEMENVITGEKTTLEFLSLDTQATIPNSIFTQQNLQKVN
jgi:outer membrane lipoprotein-sorting protein